MTTVARSGPFYDICAGRGIQLFLQQFVVFKFCAVSRRGNGSLKKSQIRKCILLSSLI